LLLGGYGQLGAEIRRLWTQADLAAPTHAQLDITDAAAVARAVEDHATEVVVNCAAFHNVERCEAEPQNAFAANALAVNAIAELCAERAATFVTFSTDYVFDGTLGRPYNESDAPRPLSVYGASKYAGELLALRLESPAYVVRTCGVYGVRPSNTKGYTFVDRIIAQARAGEGVRVVADQTVSPTFAGHLAQALLQLLRSDAPFGLYHVVNQGAVSWYEFAREALRTAGVDIEIEPISYKEWESRVRRPEFSALENAKLHSLGMTMPDWQTGIAEYLRARSALL
jgi:dTDP-4-dehydrorhamnose reductase